MLVDDDAALRMLDVVLAALFLVLSLPLTLPTFLTPLLTWRPVIVELLTMLTWFVPSLWASATGRFGRDLA